jgi:hypothetical protein
MCAGERIGHELQSFLLRFSRKNLSTRYPDSPAQRVPGSVLRFFSPATNSNDSETYVSESADLCHLLTDVRTFFESDEEYIAIPYLTAESVVLH